jgi:hypothetical protein
MAEKQTRSGSLDRYWIERVGSRRADARSSPTTLGALGPVIDSIDDIF